MSVDIRGDAVGDSLLSSRNMRLLDKLHHFLAVCENDRIVMLNQAGALLLGLSDPAKAAGQTFFSFVHADYESLADVGLEAFAEDSTVVSMKLTRPDGGVVDVDLWVHRIDAAGQPTFLVEAHDITGHLRAANALRAREQRLQGIINTVADGIFTVDERGVIQTFNPAAEAIFGFSQAEMIGSNVRALIHQPRSDGRSQVDGHWLRQLGSASNIIGRHRDGTAIHLEVAIRELYQNDQLSFTGIVRDVSARKEAEARIFHMAHHDALTGLPNRHLFGDRLDEAFKRAQRADSKLAVLFIDLNDFKPVNDTYGHACGDEVLIHTAHRLTRAVRASDTVARVGGDEFTVLLEGLRDAAEAHDVADKVQTLLAQPLALAQAKVVISASVGVGIYPDDGRDAVALMAFADQAMYRDKRNG